MYDFHLKRLYKIMKIANIVKIVATVSPADELVTSLVTLIDI